MHFDITEHRLPNDLVMPGWVVAAVGLVLAWMLVGTFPVAALIAGVGVVIVAFLGALGGGLGMGDVKLLFPLGIGLALQADSALLIGGLVASLTGGVVAIAVLLRTRRRHLKIAFGPFLLLGYWAGYFA